MKALLWFTFFQCTASNSLSTEGSEQNHYQASRPCYSAQAQCLGHCSKNTGQERRETATNSDLQDKNNSENFDVKKNPDGHQVWSSCSASQTSFSERSVLTTHLQGTIHPTVHIWLDGTRTQLHTQPLLREFNNTQTSLHLVQEVHWSLARTQSNEKLLEKLPNVYTGWWIKNLSPLGLVTKKSGPYAKFWIAQAWGEAQIHHRLWSQAAYAHPQLRDPGGVMGPLWAIAFFSVKWK